MSPPFQLLAAIALPIAAVYSLIGGGRLVKWIAEQQTRAPAPEPIERVRANLVRLRAQLEAMETRTDLPAKNLRLRALRAAYVDALCERLPAAGRQPARRRPGPPGKRPAERHLPDGGRAAGARARRQGDGRALTRRRTGRPGRPTYDRCVVLVLAVSDEVDNALYADVGAVREARLIVACGDLPFDYLGYLMNALDVPLVFVPGNHDPDVSGYRTSRAGLTLQAGLPARPPWPDGAVSADGRWWTWPACASPGSAAAAATAMAPTSTRSAQQARRARSLARRARWRQLRDGRGVDVLLTHAPPRGAGDREDPAAPGIRGPELAHRAAPAAAAAARAHPPRRRADRVHRLGRTVVRNVVGRHLLDIEPGAGARRSPAGARHAR